MREAANRVLDVTLTRLGGTIAETGVAFCDNVADTASGSRLLLKLARESPWVVAPTERKDFSRFGAIVGTKTPGFCGI